MVASDTADMFLGSFCDHLIRRRNSTQCYIHYKRLFAHYKLNYVMTEDGAGFLLLQKEIFNCSLHIFKNVISWRN
ncbi:MAG TPA: hypothetical protein VJ044_15465 [Candidatus Hodarchaeales archaeon]|nr:hypothetical protein [Candidatus Hodarchaeales archaeon]